MPFQRGEAGEEVPFYDSIVGNFMVYQDRRETILLQLLATQKIDNGFL